MTKESALKAWIELLSEIDKDNWLFVGTINPEMVRIAIEAIETTLKEEKHDES